MDLFVLLGWLVYGVIVGVISKSIYKGDVPSGLLSTVVVGTVGSFVGGFMRFLLTNEGNPFQPSGLLMGVLGGVVACYIHKKFLK
jgi:uncharacterized membrane protein YeaQ/YmgE (transglycosylase-associated protein family)